MIRNPILPGFHPDPSVIRVDGDYYIATSTFTWFPGVAIHHSRDLRHWTPISHPLTRLSQLDLRGVEDNYGVWAPCLSYSAGTFYLVYSVVHTMNSLLKDCFSYLVTARDICGPWSDPILLRGGFADHSLFHDGNRKWLVFPSDCCTEGFPEGIAVQELDPVRSVPFGPVTGIFPGTALGTTEGPHLYRIGAYYYLFTAEGGTSFGHAVTVARSETLTGPFTPDPNGPLLTSRDAPNNPLQKAGHADLFDTQTGEWYIAHLCARPRLRGSRCILGRETALQKIVWTPDGWPRLAHGGREPALFVEAPAFPEEAELPIPVRDDFSDVRLGPQYQTPREPFAEAWLSLTERPGRLRLRGGESPISLFRQSMVAVRQRSFFCTAETRVSFFPESPQQAAGLICYYNTFAFYFLCVTFRSGTGRCLDVLCGENRALSLAQAPIPLPDHSEVFLRVRFELDRLRFFWSTDGKSWEPAGPFLDAGILTDEFSHPGMMNFTGAFVGLFCQDLEGKRRAADFAYFQYEDEAEPGSGDASRDKGGKA